MSGTEAVPPEVEQFTHMIEHVWHRQRSHGRPAEVVMLPGCWSYPFDEPPGWATELAEAGESPLSWCPILSPGLLDSETVS